jgi:hypothetical protein
MDGLALALALLNARDIGVAEVTSALPNAPVVSARPRAGSGRGLIASWLGLFRVDDTRASRSIRPAGDCDSGFA